MAERERTFYYEFTKKNYDYGPGVYTNVGHRLHYTMYDLATRVWRQGVHGGVKVIKEDFFVSKAYGEKYVTKNEEAMKHFMWVKLQAQPLK
jgi:hypothetical protein